MVRGFSNAAGVGLIASLVGVGALTGGLLMASTGGFKKRIHGVLLGWALMSVCFVLVGLRPNLYTTGAGVIIWYMTLSLMNTSSQAIGILGPLRAFHWGMLPVTESAYDLTHYA